MKNLLAKLISNKKKTSRTVRMVNRNRSSFQIEKMGRFGQQLIVMSR